MKFKIACPHCSNALSLVDPKPGKYKPKCSNCGAQFAVVVEAGEPPKIRVGKLTGSSSSSQTAKPQQTELTTTITGSVEARLSPQSNVAPAIQATVLEQKNNITLPPNAAKVSQSKSSDFDETIAPELISKTTSGVANSSSFDGTVDPQHIDAPKPTGVDATIDSSTQSTTQAYTLDKTRPIAASAKAPTVMKSPAESAGDFSVNEAEQAKSKLSLGSTTPMERLGGYRIVRELGAGGMGKVYLARQLSLDRLCAIKTIQADWAANPKAIARFIREAYAAAQLTHHNVVQIYDLGQDKGTNFFSMELVGGGSLDEQLKAKGKLPPKLATTLILQSARGLKFAHDHGMVHRDIKPANLMLTNDGLVKIADLGLVKTPHSDETTIEDQADVQSMMLASARSRVTFVGSSMGTPAYMSPEQSEDAASVDKRADIYSLGCTFYALLTGRPPFEGQTMLEVITKHRHEKITRPELVVSGLPKVLGDIIERMTAKLPDDRYQDLEDVITDLEVFLELREDRSQTTISYLDERNRPRSAENSAGHGLNGVELPSDSSATPSKLVDVNKSTAAQADIPAELAGKIQLAARNYQTSPLIMARKFVPLVWYGSCGLLCAGALLMALVSGVQLLVAGAKSIASSATEAVGNMTGSQNANASTTASTLTNDNELASDFDNLVSRTQTALACALALILGPVSAVVLGGWEGRSPLALRYREFIMSSGIFSKLYWLFATILALIILYYLGLWIPAIIGALLGALAGAGYYFGIEKPLAARRRESVESAQDSLKQLRLRGMEEEQVQHAFARHSDKDWEELFENLFGYDCLRTMRTKLQKSIVGPRKVFRPYRDRLIDRWDVLLSEAKRAKEEKLLARTEKAELVAAGVSAVEAQRHADAVAATMVDAATETKQAMKDLAAGNLTDQAAEDKRQRIKQMLTDTRAGKVNDHDRRSRSLDTLLGHLLGCKFRFACAALLLLAVGMWVKANRQSAESYLQQAKSTMSNISVQGGLEEAAEAAKSTLARSTEHQWTPVLGGLVTQNNVVYIALAGLLMAWGTLHYGWKKSLVLVPVALIVLAIPNFL